VSIWLSERANRWYQTAETLFCNLSAAFLATLVAHPAMQGLTRNRQQLRERGDNEEHQSAE
jgi:hypothetical protein